MDVDVDADVAGDLGSDDAAQAHGEAGSRPLLDDAALASIDQRRGEFYGGQRDLLPPILDARE